MNYYRYINNLTLQLSQRGFNFLISSVNAKYFMDIMSALTVSFTMDDEDPEPRLVYGPTAFFHLYELSERWDVSPEDVLCIVHDMEENELVSYSFELREFSIEPCISSFVTDDGVEHEGSAHEMPLDDISLERMSAEQLTDYIVHHEGLTTVTIPMVTLRSFSLAGEVSYADRHESDSPAILTL